MLTFFASYIVNFNPVFLDVAGVQLTWYGLLYVLGFLLGMRVLRSLTRSGFSHIREESIDSLVFYLIIGMLLGARLTYVFIYDWDHYSDNYWEILYTWRGGLSFHGALIGFVCASWLFARREQRPLLEVTDCVAIAACPGLCLGRIGNFINGELYGRVTDVPWAMIFPSGGPLPRHPSQLYESFGEGCLLFTVLWILHSRVQKKGILTASFLMGYGLIRYVIEFFREPDVQLGKFLWNTTSMGQILCFLMILAGASLLLYLKALPRDTKSIPQ